MKKLYFLLFLPIFLFQTSCIDDELSMCVEEEENPNFDEFYALNFTVTLDNMGTRADGVTAEDPPEITKWENYINPEMFRVLVFNENDKFIFESKNRWVKQLDPGDNFSNWFVSVPLGSFGNDTYDNSDYDWDKIRNHLTKYKFKIAILANRPDRVHYEKTADSQLELENGYFKNDGPYWGPENCVLTADKEDWRDVFDLHHCQYDVIYCDKGEHRIKGNHSYYDFIMDDINTDKPTMGTCTYWVSFDKNDDDRHLIGGSTNPRHIKLPGKDHPIPMYGIQIFDPIPEEYWRKGTPFDLSDFPKEAFPDVAYGYNTIALLRSCVRLDLLIPKNLVNQKPNFVSLWYSNVYSRCEPMDTWTPTNEIWVDDHNNGCEWENILNYGPLVSSDYPKTAKKDYQERLSWFYGAWKEKNWPFLDINGNKISVVDTDVPSYPRIFNSLIQRNKAVWCERGDMTSEYEKIKPGYQYYHWIVYTGERNINDPNNLPLMTSGEVDGQNKNPNPYIITWIVQLDGSYYCIPLVDYDNNEDNDLKAVLQPQDGTTISSGNWPKVMDTYMNSLPSKRGKNLPYPLLRNHIYRFTIDKNNTRSLINSDKCPLEILIKSEELNSPDINFSKKVREKNQILRANSKAKVTGEKAKLKEG